LTWLTTVSFHPYIGRLAADAIAISSQREAVEAYLSRC